jgi:molecular chaperone GrpE
MSAEQNEPPLPEEELSEDDDAAREIAALRAEAEAQKDRALRALAEIENVRKRTEREREEARLYSITRFARDLLTVADNLNRALAAYPPEARKATDDSTRAVIEGVEATERELQAVLARHGVKAVEAQGQRFDPHLHQAIAEVPGGGAAPGTVVNVVQQGYVISDRLLRPAMVTVAKAEPPPRDGVDLKV